MHSKIDLVNDPQAVVAAAASFTSRYSDILLLHRCATATVALLRCSQADLLIIHIPPLVKMWPFSSEVLTGKLLSGVKNLSDLRLQSKSAKTPVADPSFLSPRWRRHQ